MKIRDILRFIESVQASPSQIPCDADFLKSLSEQFIGKDPDADISADSDEMKFLITIYKLRWNAIFDTKYDYTLTCSNTNNLWVDLAKKIAKISGIPYLKILMHTILNNVDPHDGSDLKETFNLTNFFIAYGDAILCRKRSFFEHLVINQPELSTCKLTKIKVPVTLDVLSRLRRGVHTKFSFNDKKTGEEISYTSFYAYMHEIPLAALAKDGKGKMSLELLPYLLDLVESYFEMKSDITKIEDDRFVHFKQKSRVIFDRMYDCSISDLNYLYGQKVKYADKAHLLLDVFLNIFEANQFDIDNEIQILAKFLFECHSSLRANSRALDLIYENITPEQSIVIRNNRVQMKAYERCRSLLVSLYVTQFASNTLVDAVMGFFASLLTGSDQNIVAWDLNNFIPNELMEIYSILYHLPISDEFDYESAYTEILRDHIKSKHLASSVRKETIKWLEKVAVSSLSEVGGYWYDYRKIMSALIIYRAETTKDGELINAFMDDLINTYIYEDRDHFIKQLRVNILFSNLLTKLNSTERRHIILLLDLIKQESADKEFITNCALHINRQLFSLGYIPGPQNSPRFFAIASNAETAAELKLQIPHDINRLVDLLTYYLNKFPLDHLSNEVKEPVTEYFVKIKKSILTDDEDEAIRKVESRDPIGAPT